MIEHLLKNYAKEIIYGLLALVGICFSAAAWLFYIVQFRFPDIEKSVEVFRKEQKETFRENQLIIKNKLEENLKLINDNSKKQDERISKVESNISTLKVSLVGLMTKASKPTQLQLKDLLSSADKFSSIQSAGFEKAKLSSESDQLPSTQRFQSWAGAALNLGLDVTKHEAAQGTKEREQIKTLFTRALLSDDPRWTVESNKLIVTYDNGSILFIPKSDISMVELQEIADELNQVKDTFSPQSIGVKTWLNPQNSKNNRENMTPDNKVRKTEPELTPTTNENKE